VYSGTYPENLVIDHSINLIGEDKNTTIIHAPYEIENVISISASYVNITGFKLINGYDTYGLTIEKEHNSIFGNIFYDNFFGIHLSKTALYNSISDNEFQRNIYGLVIWDAGYNEITNNIFIDNFMGIEVKGGSVGNILHHNYFRNNDQNALDSTTCVNHWNDSSEGNYWDDYDEPSEGAYDANSDGIIDTPYIIPGPSRCQDRFPLASSFGANNPPNLPSNPSPAQHATAVDVNADLSWIGGDSNRGDTVTYDIYFGTASNPPLKKSGHMSTSYDPGVMSSTTTYYWKIVAKDTYGTSTIGPVWDFTTIYMNHPPTTPFNPTPQKGTSSVNINQDLYWYCTDADGNPLTYDVYFGTTNPPTTKVSSNQSGSTYHPGEMNYSSEYYWQIVAWDNHGASSTGPLWSFTTTQSHGNNVPILSPNKIPHANASASNRTGFVNSSIVFTASYSYDEDGTITNYTWDFGDNTSGYGMLITHTYEKAKVYTVQLTVTDNTGVNDTDSFTLIISQPTTPTVLQIYGPRTGKQNINYNFTVVIIEPETYQIHYVFYWGDGQNNATEFLPNDIEFVQQHQWTSPGIFPIKVFAIDSNYDTVASVDITIFIDVLYCMNIGYLIDENSDGIYDVFYSNQTKAQTVTEQQATGVYLINNDNDSDWEYMYDSDNNSLTSYHLASDKGNTEQYIVLIVLILVIILLVVLIVIINRKKPEQESGKPEEKSEKPETESEAPEKEPEK
jgi:parallel beta-helix repeat protein